MTLNNEAWHLVTGPAGQRDPAKALKLIQDAMKLVERNYVAPVTGDELAKDAL